MKCVNFTLTIAALLSFSASLFGQNVTSSVLGTVVDPANAAVAGAVVQLTNQSTGAVSHTVTDSTGLFRIVNLLTGTYSVAVDAKGFKKLNVKDVVVDASEAHDLGRLPLSLGDVTESVSVTAEVAAVQRGDRRSEPALDPVRRSTGRRQRATGRVPLDLGAREAVARPGIGEAEIAADDESAQPLARQDDGLIRAEAADHLHGRPRAHALENR